jgi:hypothetical protein
MQPPIPNARATLAALTILPCRSQSAVCMAMSLLASAWCVFISSLQQQQQNKRKGVHHQHRRW